MFQKVRDLFAPKVEKPADDGLTLDKLNMYLGIAKSFGFDAEAKLAEALPKMVAAALVAEHKAGCKLMGAISLSDDGTHLVLTLWRIMPDGSAEVWESFPIDDVPAILQQVKNTLAQKDHVPETTAPRLSFQLERGNGPAAADAITTDTPGVEQLAGGGYVHNGDLYGTDPESDEHNFAAAGAAGAAGYLNQQPDQQQ